MVEMARKSINNEYYQSVLFPVVVSQGENCWDLKRVCPHFDNEGGHGTCALGFYLNDKEWPIKKPKECLDLKKF